MTAEGVKRLAASVFVSVCLQDKTKTAETTMTTVASITEIDHHKSSATG